MVCFFLTKIEPTQKHLVGFWFFLFALCVVDGEVKPQSGHTKDYKIDICYFSPRHASLWSKSDDWLISLESG
jgi:hypothetical protein